MRCTLAIAGFLPQALVAQRIEQKTSKFLTPPLHRTGYRVVGERSVVVRLACDENLEKPPAFFLKDCPPSMTLLLRLAFFMVGGYRLT